MKRLSTLFYCTLLTCSTFAQIPNASFENWTHDTASGGYDTPNNWGNPNPYTSALSTYVCEKGSPGFSGSYYLKLTSKSVLVAVIPGLAGTGTATLSGTSAVNISGGFALTTRPATITGEWQYAPTGTDTGHVIVYLFKWNTTTNSEDTIAYTDKALTGSVTSWTSFSINLNYYSGLTPDSGRIVLSASKIPPATATAGSYLYMDTLAFAGNVPAGVVTIKNNAAPTIIYPNPTTGITNVFYYSIAGGNVTITICDVSGRKLKAFNRLTYTGDNTLPVNVSGLSHGMYILNITDALGGIEEKKLIIQ